MRPDKFLRSQCVGFGYTVTSDCLMVHRIVKLEKEYSFRYSLLYKYYRYIRGMSDLSSLQSIVPRQNFGTKKIFSFLANILLKKWWLQPTNIFCVYSDLVFVPLSFSQKTILLSSLWMKCLQHNIPSKRSYIAILPHGRFRASTLFPSWGMNACGSTKDVWVGG